MIFSDAETGTAQDPKRTASTRFACSSVSGVNRRNRNNLATDFVSRIELSQFENSDLVGQAGLQEHSRTPVFSYAIDELLALRPKILTEITGRIQSVVEDLGFGMRILSRTRVAAHQA